MFLVRRLAAGVVLLFVIASAAFFLAGVTGGDPARTIAGPSATLAQVAAKRHELGLDQALGIRYLQWLGHAVRGDLGTSWFTQQPVTTLLAQSLPVSLSLVVSTIVVTAVVSTLLGVLAAVRGGWLDTLLQVLSTLTFAVPNFLLGLVLALLIAVRLGWLPAVGYVKFTESPSGWLAAITLPALALALGAIATVATQVRGSMIDVLRLDFVRTLRSRGLPTRTVVFQHALRNAAPAGLTVLSVQFIALVSGSVVVEKVFNVPGIGSQANTASAQGDVPLVLGVVVVTVAVVVVVNLVLDVVQGWLNPKVRVS